MEIIETEKPIRKKIATAAGAICISSAVMYLAYSVYFLVVILSFYIPPIKFSEEDRAFFELFALLRGFVASFYIFYLFLSVLATVGFSLTSVALINQKRTKYVKISLILLLVISALICGYGLIAFFTVIQELIFSGTFKDITFVLMYGLPPLLLALPSLILCAIAIQRRVWLPPVKPNEFNNNGFNYNGFNNIT